MLRILIVATLFVAPIAVQAQTPAEALSTCLADNTTGKDRKDLARWVFLAMAAHPEIKQFTSDTTEKATEDINRRIGAIVTRLLAEDCAQETKVAFEQGGSGAIRIAFETLGKLAMQELMSHPDVSACLGALGQHIDEAKLKSVFGSQ